MVSFSSSDRWRKVGRSRNRSWSCELLERSSDDHVTLYSVLYLSSSPGVCHVSKYRKLIYRNLSRLHPLISLTLNLMRYALKPAMILLPMIASSVHLLHFQNQNQKIDILTKPSFPAIREPAFDHSILPWCYLAVMYKYSDVQSILLVLTIGLAFLGFLDKSLKWMETIKILFYTFVYSSHVHVYVYDRIIIKSLSKFLIYYVFLF